MEGIKRARGMGACLDLFEDVYFSRKRREITHFSPEGEEGGL